jgi:hypothetical protein
MHFPCFGLLLLITMSVRFIHVTVSSCNLLFLINMS